MIRIGILGAGSMGALHAAAWAALPDVEVTAVFSRTPERAAAVAAACNAVATAEARRLIEAPDIDAVDICVPTQAHGPLVLSALERG
ncbi:MAG: Gfo/Idh/MocA family oxidoreductase, partial [Proteobacteria bacterium]|nr:Gfo/Idh/MocA family oxidoreductase [Pseudomonadota bacterium]